MMPPRSTSELRETVQSSSATVEDIQTLATRDYPLEIDDMLAIAKDHNRALSMRLTAINAIARAGAAGAVALRSIACDSDARVRRESILAYGRVGTELLGLDVHGAEARYADVLIAARHGLPAVLPETPVPTDKCGTAGSPATIRNAGFQDLDDGVLALGDEALGVDPTPESAISLQWSTMRWLLAFDPVRLAKASTNGAPRLHLLGILSEEVLFGESDYMLLACLIAEVGKGSSRVLGFSPDGACTLTGQLDSCAPGWRLALGPTSEIDTLPLDLRARLLPTGIVKIEHATLLDEAVRRRKLPSTT